MLTHRLANQDDYKQIKQFLSVHFIPYEPIYKALDVSPSTPGIKLFWDGVVKCLGEPISFITLDPSGKIVGACLNYRFQPIAETSGRWVKQERLPVGMSGPGITLAFLARLEDGLVERLAAMDSCANQLLLAIICVDIELRGHGLGVKLVDLTIEKARQLGYDCIVSQATAKASQILFKRLGFQVLTAVRHVDFTDEKGIQMLTCQDGTDEGQLVFMKI